MASNGSKNIDVYLKRAFMALEDRDFERADVFSEQVLNVEPECAEAYLIKLMATNKVPKIDQLFMVEEKFWEDRNYLRALIFASEDLSNALREAVYEYGKRNSNTKEGVTVARMRKAKEAFENTKRYKDSDARAEICSRKINETLNKYEREKAAKAKKGLFAKLFK